MKPVQMVETFRSVVQFRRFERDPVLRRLARAANVDDLRRIAKRRLPAGVFDYIDGAAEDERALDRNQADFEKLLFNPRVLRDVSNVDTSTNILGRSSPLPLVLAPTGFGRIADSQGELAVARSAAKAGVTYSLSTMATRSIEEVAAVNDGDKWFQVYVWKDKDRTEELLERAAAAGYSTIIITVDVPQLGRRERDVRRGFTLPPKIGLETIIDGVLHPSWTWDFINAEPIGFANVSGSDVGDGSSPVSLMAYINNQFDPALSWDEIGWFKERWKGPIVLKGIQCVDDARLAVDNGIDAIALSNHGGRQLDDSPSPITLLPSVVEAVGGQTEIIVDGGVRRGSDIVKAVSLGATTCMIGRPYMYALGAGGERGVDHLLEMFADGMQRTMALVGAQAIDDLDPEVIGSA
ncbi:MAG: alpha-hydroxy-acid oxidizing protein [Actinomycetia bacterium]|nr:alpha-hydroxy-acid oxidizing protein [Actinomycetes bacterium]